MQLIITKPSPSAGMPNAGCRQEGRTFNSFRPLIYPPPQRRNALEALMHAHLLLSSERRREHFWARAQSACSLPEWGSEGYEEKSA